MTATPVRLGAWWRDGLAGAFVTGLAALLGLLVAGGLSRRTVSGRGDPSRRVQQEGMMSTYEVDLGVVVSTDGSAAAGKAVDEVVAALREAGTPARTVDGPDGSFVIEVQLPASAPSDAVLEATGRLRDAATLRKVRMGGRSSLDEWVASMKERTVTATELTETSVPADSAALTF